MGKIYNIVLACAGGMSTSLLMTKMQAAAEARGIAIEIQAIGVNVERINEITEKDVVLLGPQVRFQEKGLKEKFPDLPIQVIDMRDYGMMNGENVLNTAIDLIEASR